MLCPAWVNTQIMNSARNRPDALRNPIDQPVDPRHAAYGEIVRNLLQSGLSPSAVADRVLDAIREEQLYILTHPEMSEIIRVRFENILAQQNPVPRTLG